jgi:hypothetical protein
MPSHGVEIIDGIPVYLKGANMFAFRPEQAATATTTTQSDLKLGTYDAATKKATWTTPPDSWLNAFRESLVPRSRKA